MTNMKKRKKQTVRDVNVIIITIKQQRKRIYDWIFGYVGKKSPLTTTTTTYNYNDKYVKDKYHTNKKHKQNDKSVQKLIREKDTK